MQCIRNGQTSSKAKFGLRSVQTKLTYQWCRMGFNRPPENTEKTCSECTLSRKTFKEIRWQSIWAINQGIPLSHICCHNTQACTRSYCSTLFCAAYNSLPKAALPTKNTEKGHHWEIESAGWRRWQNIIYNNYYIYIILIYT